ncbi:hypothetical protein [Lysobacter antibioticus]|uniref:hypothetical protein n=1 Tax=Lysobacter antibioticus TaxID=84531 RepID=UPI0011409139|nr:hypothetical protein [Lysobacter antibioticus]
MSMTACSPGQSSTERVDGASHAPARAVPDIKLGVDARNATYIVEGEPVTLVDGIDVRAIVPGAASKQITRFIGRETELDLDGDGRKDMAFLLTQDMGGSGTFYYAAAALNTPQGYKGTNAVFLGDRISVQKVDVVAERPSEFWVSYGERATGEHAPEEAMSMISKDFKWDGASLVEVGASPAQGNTP